MERVAVGGGRNEKKHMIYAEIKHFEIETLQKPMNKT